MKWLLKLYPPAWQRRYRSEVEIYLEAETPKLRTALDLIAGAIDAWLNPSVIPETSRPRSDRTMVTAARSASIDISKADGIRSALWALGVGFALTAAGVVLDKAHGPHIFIEALLYSALFIAFTVSSKYTYLKPYSRAARNVIIGLSIPGWYLFVLGAIALAQAV